MKSHVVCLGVIDKNNKQHLVNFNEGLNIITGASSTGKSAMIDIFDYCMGSSEFTVPKGVITDNAETYVLVLAINENYLVLARSPTKKFSLLSFTTMPNISKFNNTFFPCDIPIKQFREDLSNRFGLDISNLDEDLDNQNYRYQNRKGSRASIRHGMSFLLQHQNLIANKHSIFYRFDQAEKREATIQQFKVFAGFVTAEYLSLSQKLNEEQRRLSQLERLEIRKEEQSKFKASQLNSLLLTYKVTTGNDLLSKSAETILLNPRDNLRLIKQIEVDIQDDSDELLISIKNLEKHKTELEKNIYHLKLKHIDISSSISYVEAYKDDLQNLKTPKEANIYQSHCPFCRTEHDSINTEANHLQDSIVWLNNQLSKIPSLIDSFYPEQNSVESQLKQLDGQLKAVKSQIRSIKDKENELQGYRDLLTLGLKEKLRVEIFLENEISNQAVNEDIVELKTSISNIKNSLKRFDVAKEMEDAEAYINTQMNLIGNLFEFEATYKPLSLKFDLETFELYHVVKNEKVYLRSTGSGANWLYSHISLFLALQRFFCKLGNKSAIPSILFLDQPSQVYFPDSIYDNDASFDPEKFKELRGNKDKLTEDVSAVTNLFIQLAKFCDETQRLTGIKPQIIVLEHADNLQLGDYDFNFFVHDRRWRGGKKFIDVQ